jgi:hypothetical protein
MYDLAFPEVGWSGNRVGSKTSFCARFGVRLTDPDHGVAKPRSALLWTLEFARQPALGVLKRISGNTFDARTYRKPLDGHQWRSLAKSRPTLN